MARIRTIKPDFWKHEELSALPEATHMLAAALLNYADDEGYFNANPKLVQSECCPLREPSVSIQDSLTQLANVGYIRVGKAGDGKLYGHVVHFNDHQRINRPTESKIKSLDVVWEASLSTHTQVTEQSLPEGKGKEGEWKAAPPSLHEAEEKPVSRETEDLGRYKRIQSELFEAGGISGNPSPALLNISPILVLIENGYTLHGDILPVIRSITARGKTPTTWAYFVKAITENKSANGALPEKPESKITNPVVWITEDDPRWAALQRRAFETDGKKITPQGSRHQPGLGHAFPADWATPPT